MTIINGLNSNLLGAAATSSANAVSGADAAPDSERGRATAASSGAATAQISTPGQLFSELQQLSQSDPSQFKTVATQLAASFKDAAGQATGHDAQVLNKLADTFTQAAQTGTLAAPQHAPAGHGHHGHHGAHAHAGGEQSGAVQQAFTNALALLQQSTQDGSVGSATPAA